MSSKSSVMQQELRTYQLHNRDQLLDHNIAHDGLLTALWCDYLFCIMCVQQ